MSLSPEVNLAGYGVPEEMFRSLAGSLPTGVTVVTTLGAAGEPVGMTSGAVCGLSCSPPLLLTCIATGSRTLAAMLAHGRFCVNVLDADAAGIADRFANHSGDRFAGVAWTPGPGGVPVLAEGTVANSVCDVYRTVPAGDHLIVIGLIVAGEHRAGANPLLYHRRRYAGFLPPGS